MIEIQRMEMPRDVVPFVRTWWPIYRDDPHWVPPLIFERKRFFDPAKNPYFQTADVAYFQALRGGEGVGTIAAAVDHTYQKQDPGAGFFGFFEFVDDAEVSRALFDAAAEWLRGNGMQRALGPSNFNTNHEFGLLIDGFDTDPVVANPHNLAYFQQHYEQLGMTKAMDWYAYWFDKQGVSPRFAKIAERILRRYPEIKMRSIGSGKSFERDKQTLHDLYDDAWEENWGHVAVSPAEFEFLADGFKRLIDPRVCWAVDIGDETAAMSVTLPNLNQVVKKMNGSLFPTGWFHFLNERRKIKTLRFFMLGVKKKYQHLPLGALLYVQTWREGLKYTDYDSVECSLILENNHRMRGPLEKLGGDIYKTYRTYQVTL